MDDLIDSLTIDDITRAQHKLAGLCEDCGAEHDIFSRVTWVPRQSYTLKTNNVCVNCISLRRLRYEWTT